MREAWLQRFLEDIKEDVRALRQSVDEIRQQELPDLKSLVSALQVKISFWRVVAGGMGSCVLMLVGYILRR